MPSSNKVRKVTSENYPTDDGDEDEEVDVNEDYEAESDDEPV